MAHQLGDLDMHFTSLKWGSGGLLPGCVLGIITQAQCMAQGLIPATPTGQPPQLLLLPHVDTARSEAEEQVHRTQRTLGRSLLSLFGEGDPPFVFFHRTLVFHLSVSRPQVPWPSWEQ